ncbi:LAMI_0E08108g1_1 [Lachancea mirantina]|uniref:3-methyl-2-oxobutanoate hydroxymethyltransferase n=1 Tax=Lachancea mirantina TaxID=1230905 RepID=A0A1G4JMR3_9SACH|nr:LAMI_0E08108g1_1 [Lachancea mirantina]
MLRLTKLGTNVVGRRLYSVAPVTPVNQITIADLFAKHVSKQPITMITAYDYITGTWAQAAECDMVLVGDSLAMCALGYNSTTEISLQEFKYHVAAVCRAPGTAFVVADMPFGSFESSLEKGIETAVSLMQVSSKVGAVKLEVGSSSNPNGLRDYSLRLAEELCSRGIPVVGHIGLTPQRVHALSGYKAQGGADARRAEAIHRTAQELERVGCFSVVLECVPHKVSETITRNLNIPTIGIGAGKNTSGQVLVQSDLLGMLPGKLPRLAKQYGHLYEDSVRCIRTYMDEVTTGKFPENEKHGFRIKETVWLEYLAKVGKGNGDL